MPVFLNKITFLKPNIGYFPELEAYLKHGFSWGKDAGNMQFSLGDHVEVRMRVQKFLNKLGMGKINESINMLPEHKDRIIDIDANLNEKLKQHRFGRSVKCDAFFTTLPNLTLTTKPGDCTTAIVYCPRIGGEDVIGIIHTGRRGVQQKLTIKSINHLTYQYKCKTKDIKLGIVPHIFQSRRKFESVEQLDTKIWKGFIDKKEGNFYPGETELAIKQYIDAGIQEENFFVYDVDTYGAASRGEAYSYKYHYEMTVQGKKVPNGRFIVAVRRR